MLSVWSGPKFCHVEIGLTLFFIQVFGTSSYSIQYNTIQYNTFYLLQCKQCTFCKITIIKQQSSQRDFELLETIKYSCSVKRPGA